jgi:NADH pyrophosphatase NudC (nudix superfamily)
MEEAVAERKAREVEETKRRQIEKELGDLSTSLFSQANEMVAEERKARARAEERIGVVENQLDAKDQTLNETVRRLEAVSSEKEIEHRELSDLRHVVQALDKRNLGIERRSKAGSIRVMNSHTPFKTEYLGFLQHLRSLASSSFTPPPVATFLPQPFLARLINEDS